MSTETAVGAPSPVLHATFERTVRRFDSFDVTLVLVLPGRYVRNPGGIKAWLLENIGAIAHDIGETVKPDILREGE